MGKTRETRQLEQAIWEFTHEQNPNIYGAFEVTIGYLEHGGGKGFERADYVTIGNDGIIRAYELKTSVSDFHSTAKLSWIGHFNYLVMTRQVYEKIDTHEISWSVGIIVSDGSQGMSLVHKPHKRQRSVGQSAVIVESMMRSAVRDATKLYNREDYWNPALIKPQPKPAGIWAIKGDKGYLTTDSSGTDTEVEWTDDFSKAEFFSYQGSANFMKNLYGGSVIPLYTLEQPTSRNLK